MLLSTVSVLVVAQSSSEIPEGLMNNPVYNKWPLVPCYPWEGDSDASLVALYVVLRCVVFPNQLKKQYFCLSAGVSNCNL